MTAFSRLSMQEIAGFGEACEDEDNGGDRLKEPLQGADDG